MGCIIKIVSTILVFTTFTRIGGQRQGSHCVIMDTGRAGVCRPFADCQSVKEAARNGTFPQTCNVEGTVQNVCCPETIVEGSHCTLNDTGKTGVCRPFADCQSAKEAAGKGIFPQKCDVEGTVQNVCCPETINEGSHCTLNDTGKTGVCRPFADCQSAKEAAGKGIFPQKCDVESTVQNVCCPLETIVEGSNCTLKHTGGPGVCRSVDNCEVAFSEGVFHQKCNSTDNELELMCCTKADGPPLLKGHTRISQLPVGSKAADYCIKLAEKFHTCQETPSNIVYYKTPMATTAEAPYYGRLGIRESEGGQITWPMFSHVTLVSDQWVLLSAYAIGADKYQYIGLGGTFTPVYNPDEIYGITTQHIHRLDNYGFSDLDNSMALYQLDRRVTFTARIRPACLHTGTPLPDSGFIITGRDSASLHYKTTMQILPQEECSRVFPTHAPHSAHDHDHEICSRPVNTTGGCSNFGGWKYSGSPLTLHNNPRACTHLLVGLGCDYNFPPCTRTNTRISSYIPWIEEIMWPESGVIDDDFVV